ncbi:MAG: hypothetical protein A2Z14_12445 [Chloroflexi bacterium RBG_16_48_8]|nr:MAG: hypothetical protein A2Z14_12445 [Chloroflexi bacterium RBG_16_48_8]
MDTLSKIRRGQFRGQSIVEFTLLLPLLLMLLSTLIEFGFVLNEYLDLIDTTRETARYLADQEPFTQPNNEYREDFYIQGLNEMGNTLDRAGWITLDPAVDDLVISLFSISTNVSAARYPAQWNDDRCTGSPPNGGPMGWRVYCNKTSKFTADDVINRFKTGTSEIPPNNGVVLVEIFYNYHMRLGLPWVTGIVGDTIELHAYSFAPNPYAEPD